MNDFKFKWLTLIKALINGLIRVAAIYKNKILHTKEKNDHSNYYKNLNILDDKWFKDLPTNLPDQTIFLKIKRCFVLFFKQHKRCKDF